MNGVLNWVSLLKYLGKSLAINYLYWKIALQLNLICFFDVDLNKLSWSFWYLMWIKNIKSLQQKSLLCCHMRYKYRVNQSWTLYLVKGSNEHFLLWCNIGLEKCTWKWDALTFIWFRELPFRVECIPRFYSWDFINVTEDCVKLRKDYQSSAARHNGIKWN